MSSIAIKEQRKRDLTAITIAVLIHLLIIGGFFLSHLLFFQDIVEYRGPVLVKLGRADAPEELTDTMPKAPESTEDEQSSTVEETVEIEEEVQKGNPQETVSPDDKQSENAVERPVSDEENGDRGDAESSSEENNTESSPVNEETSTVESDEVVTVTEGSEEGNSWETTFEASEGTVARSFGNAIYLYMPLPQFVEEQVFENIKDDVNLISRTAEKKRRILSEYYELFDNQYLLKDQRQPHFSERPQIWSILAEGGYDLQNPEYKLVAPPLRDLIITFTVDTGDDQTNLSNIQVYRSSGPSEIDEAVIYGFQQAFFSNSSDVPVKGRFTYRF
jgi:hypothetical protein